MPTLIVFSTTTNLRKTPEEFGRSSSSSSCSHLMALLVKLTFFQPSRLNTYVIIIPPRYQWRGANFPFLCYIFRAVLTTIVLLRLTGLPISPSVLLDTPESWIHTGLPAPARFSSFPLPFLPSTLGCFLTRE